MTATEAHVMVSCFAIAERLARRDEHHGRYLVPAGRSAARFAAVDTGRDSRGACATVPGMPLTLLRIAADG